MTSSSCWPDSLAGTASAAKAGNPAPEIIAVPHRNNMNNVWNFISVSPAYSVNFIVLPVGHLNAPFSAIVVSIYCIHNVRVFNG